MCLEGRVWLWCVQPSLVTWLSEIKFHRISERRGKETDVTWQRKAKKKTIYLGNSPEARASRDIRQEFGALVSGFASNRIVRVNWHNRRGRDSSSQEKTWSVNPLLHSWLYFAIYSFLYAWRAFTQINKRVIYIFCTNMFALCCTHGSHHVHLFFDGPSFIAAFGSLRMCFLNTQKGFRSGEWSKVANSTAR